MIDRDKFWAKTRPIFGPGLDQSQVDGVNAILDEFERRYPDGDLRWLAYYLATAFWETAHRMQPVREAYWQTEEWRKEHLTYYPYYGRGLVQLTWRSNYLRQSQQDRVGVNLVANPDKALEPAISAAIMFVGMQHGDFGGGGMAVYFHDDVEDPEDARHLVNGTDHAGDIASVYRQFKRSLI